MYLQCSCQSQPIVTVADERSERPEIAGADVIFVGVHMPAAHDSPCLCVNGQTSLLIRDDVSLNSGTAFVRINAPFNHVPKDIK